MLWQGLLFADIGARRCRADSRVAIFRISHTAERYIMLQFSWRFRYSRFFEEAGLYCRAASRSRLPSLAARDYAWVTAE